MSSEKKGQPKAHPSDSREALLQAAKRVFAQKGFEGATVKDLADEAGVNVSLISYHFGGKENLYRACLESFGHERVEAAERVLKSPSSLEDFTIRLKLFGEEIIDIHQRDENVCKLIHRAIDTCDPVSVDIFKDVFIRIFAALQNFISEAQKAGLVRSELDSECAAALIFGALVHIVRMEDLRQRIGLDSIFDPVFREKVLEHWVETQTQGVFTK